MDGLWILAAARPWHYWLAVLLLATGMLLLLGIAIGYYRQVLVPLHQRRMAELEPPAQPQRLVTAADAPRRLEASSRRRAA